MLRALISSSQNSQLGGFTVWEKSFSQFGHVSGSKISQHCQPVAEKSKVVSADSVINLHFADQGTKSVGGACCGRSRLSRQVVEVGSC